MGEDEELAFRNLFNVTIENLRKTITIYIRFNLNKTHVYVTLKT